MLRMSLRMYMRADYEYAIRKMSQNLSSTLCAIAARTSNSRLFDKKNGGKAFSNHFFSCSSFTSRILYCRGLCLWAASLAPKMARALDAINQIFVNHFHQSWQTQSACVSLNPFYRKREGIQLNISKHIRPSRVVNCHLVP